MWVENEMGMPKSMALEVEGAEVTTVVRKGHEEVMAATAHLRLALRRITHFYIPCN